MLSLQNVAVGYGASNVIKGASLYIKPGEAVALIGANGAGKSTLIGAIAGLNKAAAGKIMFLNQDITNKPAYTIVTKGISLVPERREIFDALTVKDNLILGSYYCYKQVRAVLDSELRAIFRLFPALQGKEDRLAGSLSGGEQQMLAIGRALMAKPKLLLLDEPSIGLAPIVIQEIFRILANLKQLGTTILLVEQNAQLALRFSDRAYVLERGEILFSGESSSLLKDARIEAAYLGKNQKQYCNA